MTSSITDRVYGVSSDVAVKAPCLAVTAGVPVPLVGLGAVGGYTPNVGDRILVKDQTDPTANGIYNASQGAWQRSGDFDGPYDCVQGTLVVVYFPNSQATILQLTTPNPIIGTTPLNFASFVNPNQTPYYPQTPIELQKSVTPINLAYGPGSVYRYGTKGGAGRVADAVIAGAVLTSASGGFAGAVAGQIAVVVDGGASRTGGRPAPLITTILSVQSINQITLSTPVIAPASVVMNGTLNATTLVTATSVNPITGGVGLTRNWAITGTNIPASTTVAYTSSSTLTLSQAATGSGTFVLTLTAPIEVCFGYDDSAAINAALSLPYPITDIKDNFLMAQPINQNGTGCNNVSMPSALILMPLGNNTQHCVTLSGLDRTNAVNYLVGIRYLPFKFEIGEIDCCNTGLDGIQLQQSNWSTVRTRLTNTFRNALGEFFLVNGHWQEGNTVDITCGRVGLHFHHKVNKAQVYQTLGGYRIMGRAPGLNSVYLGINATTQPDQCGTGIRLYASGAAVADGGISQNVWGGQAFCELDGQRSTALSFGSDIGNSAVVFVDASAAYVIEGAASAAVGNTYRSNTFSNMVIEDISQGSDTRGGFQYYAMANTTVQSTTVLASSAGPWGQFQTNGLFQNGPDNFVRSVQRLSFQGLQLIPNNGGSGGILPIIQGNSATGPAPAIINGQDYNTITVPVAGVYATCIAGDNNLFFFAQDASSGGGCLGIMTTDTTTITLIGNTLVGVTFRRLATTGLQATSTSGVRNLRVMAFASGA